jgi:hypothetical protein
MATKKRANKKTGTAKAGEAAGNNAARITRRNASREVKGDDVAVEKTIEAKVSDDSDTCRDGETTDDSVARIMELERQLDIMRKENEKKSQKIADMIAEVSVAGRKKKQQGSDRVKRRKLSGADAVNYDTTVMILKDKVYPNHKFLPDNWHIFSLEEGTLSCRILAELDIPEGTTKEDYWSTIREVVMYSFSKYRHQGSRKMESVMRGKRLLPFSLNIVPFFQFVHCLLGYSNIDISLICRHTFMASHQTKNAGTSQVSCIVLHLFFVINHCVIPFSLVFFLYASKQKYCTPTFH